MRFCASPDCGVWVSVFSDDNVLGLRHSGAADDGNEASGAMRGLEQAGSSEQARGAKAFKAIGTLLAGKGQPGAPPANEPKVKVPKKGAPLEATFVATLRAGAGGTRVVVDGGPPRARKPDGLGTARVSLTMPHGLVLSMTSAGTVNQVRACVLPCMRALDTWRSVHFGARA